MTNSLDKIIAAVTSPAGFSAHSPKVDVPALVAALRAAQRHYATRPNQDGFAVRSAQACLDFVNRLAVHGNLTPNQQAYAEKLIGWAQPRQHRAAVPSAVLGGAVKRVFELFAKAKAAGLKFPKVRLEAADGQKVVLSQAGARSRYQGDVMITDGGSFGENKFFGRIDPAGNLDARREMTGPVRKLIDDLAADPAGVASIYGRKTGRCCFCGLGLTDGRSVAVGYGPVCAEKFDLPWGEERVAPVHVELTDEQAETEETRAIQAREAAEERARMERKFGRIQTENDEEPISLYEHCRRESGLEGRKLDEYVNRYYGHN